MNSIPENIKNSLYNYIENGIKPGKCLTSILENKLMESFLSSDDNVVNNMKGIVFYLHTMAPASCWGSTQKVDSWIQQGGWNGALKKS